MTDTPEPRGALQTRTLTMPADTNGAGTIFGGWVMSQMDIAGAMAAADHVRKPVVTVAVDSMHFVAPINVSDIVCCYTDVIRTGRTSITIHVETWVIRHMIGQRHKVTEADFTFVAVDPTGAPATSSPQHEGSTP